MGPALRIAKRIWPAWRERAEHDDEWELQLLLAPNGDPADAERALRESVLEVQAAFEAEADRTADPEPPFAGEWSWSRVPSGVMVKVTECDVFDTVLPAVAAALERRGIAGKLDLWRQPPGVEPPAKAPALACRMRVRGERIHGMERSYRWQADSDEYATTSRRLIAGAVKTQTVQPTR
jgi:hypothetical protein